MEEKSELEKIADLLLDGTINNVEAEDLVRRAKLQRNFKDNYDREETEELIIEEDENLLQLKDRKGRMKAFVEFYTERNEIDDTFIWLKLAISKISNRGYFSRLYKKLEEFAKKKGAVYISLDVDKHDDDTIGKYDHYGFVSVGEFEVENREMILMRKYLE